MLQVEGLTKRFGALIAVNDLSFHVEAGQVFGIAGPNGAGKSTLYNLITGNYSYEGKVVLDGRDISGMPPHRIARRGISRTFQIPEIFPSLTVEETVHVGSRFGSRGGVDVQHASEIIDVVGLGEELYQKTGALNLLGKKKLMIGAALATKPKILMLDEPMAGSNTTEILSLMELIKKINQDLGVTIIIIEHFMKVLTDLAQVLMIIESGTLVCSGKPAEVIQDERVVKSYLGDSYA
ncbi:ABC transporter ATP-binding protein [Desulfobulbus rhabdoformis]|uniref:ABC transporter ATP-binding protein n=1 Tax=Desulfobulbus rhabdoformis TaxID=34032 RepID=UPI001965694C|nr:ABC transporter ATP-binding protein [Desulfobulbus rhabdoformis]MBM9615914.1 ABC transporter ATP-binding protein [Desulfobulbus rhabdoformis]